MKASYKWLQSHMDSAPGVDELAQKLIMSGSEVEEINHLDTGLDHVVVGRIAALYPHPDADRLRICEMDVGQAEPVTIVTGAPNVFQGAYVPVALVGANLPCGVAIKKSKLRGVMSHGMLCSGEELCIDDDTYEGASTDGILILQGEPSPGAPIAPLLGLDDAILEVSLYANRADCQSIYGLAREAAAVVGAQSILPGMDYDAGTGDVHEHLCVEVQATDLCPRYMARVVRDVRIAPSPAWLRQRLLSGGIRPINNIVDITNYVMLELGQPMHAFDHRQITDGKIVVRRAKNGENIKTLDENEYTLTDSMLVIADARRPIAVAGVMGGEHSGIAADTTTVVFESATFDWASVRVTSRQLGLRSESSARYEKGLPPQLAKLALDRACALVQELGCAKVLSGTIDSCTADMQPRALTIDPARVNAHLGLSIDTRQMADIMRRLGFGADISGDMLTLEIPWWRGDVDTFADVAEEVQRLYGYDKIPSQLPPSQSAGARRTPWQNTRYAIKQLCQAMGLYETSHYSFMAPGDADRLRLEETNPLRRYIRLINPLGEEYSIMRTTLLPALLRTVAFNLNRQAHAVKLFEMNRVYLPDSLPLTDLPRERDTLCLAIAQDGMDFFALKGMVEALCRALRVKDYTVAPCDAPYMHPGRSALLMHKGAQLGLFGQIHPEVAQSYEIGQEVYVAELDVAALAQAATPNMSIRPLPRFPAVHRDLAVVVDEGQLVGPMIDAIRAAGGKLLEDVELFDIYQGWQIGSGKKSVAFSMTLRAGDHTLVDDEAQACFDRVVAALSTNFGAQIRA